ncbi:hypothetical protein GJAV_G00155920 [Gymnothorax javanicus]|nr:hypothetical protein GJAV_G00155920 [Gymnothorax javanicus]
MSTPDRDSEKTPAFVSILISDLKEALAQITTPATDSKEATADLETLTTDFQETSADRSTPVIDSQENPVHPHFWSSLQSSEQVCPLCKAHLQHTGGKVNILLEALVEEFRRAQVKKVVEAGYGGVASNDSVTSTMDVRHLEPHLSASRLKGHKLVGPLRDLEQRACAAHGRPLELYCRKEQRCVCALCVEDTSTVVPAEVECDSRKEAQDISLTWCRNWAESDYTGAAGRLEEDCVPVTPCVMYCVHQAILLGLVDEMERSVADRGAKVAEINQAAQLSTGCIDQQKEDIEIVFRKAVARVEEAESELLQPLIDRRREVQREAEHITLKLESEISQLQQRITDVHQIANQEDHILFLQSYPSLSVLEKSDMDSVVLDSELRLGSVREVLCSVTDRISRELEQLSSTDIDRIQKFSVPVTFDPNTANPRLILSEDRTEVRDGGVEQDVPIGPERFDLFGSVLGRPLLSKGRSYWEVQVIKKTGWDLGVAKASIKRKGVLRMSPESGFWCLVLYNGRKYAALTSPTAPVPAQEAQQGGGVCGL